MKADKDRALAAAPLAQPTSSSTSDARVRATLKGYDWEAYQAQANKPRTASTDDDLYEGDDLDTIPEEGGLESDALTATKYYKVPLRYAEMEFHRYLGFKTEEEVEECADDWYDEQWEVYQLKVQYGQLSQGTGLW